MNNNDQTKKAKQEFERRIRQNPKDAEALHALGLLSVQEDDLTNAINYFEQTVEADTQNPTYQLHLANALKLQGLFNQAAELLIKTIEQFPDYIPAINNLGTVYFAQAKFDDAIQCYREAIERAPDYLDAYYNLAIALVKQEKWQEAKKNFEYITEHSSEHFAAKFQLATILMKENNFETALKLLLSIEENLPYHFETQANIATCYLRLGKLNQARLHYQRALDLKPDDTQSLFNLGIIYSQQNDLDKAIQYYQKVLLVEPDSFAAHNNLGIAFLTKNYPDFALKHFKEALRIQPKNQAIQHTVNALSQNKTIDAAPSEYVRVLFDAYADHYEPHLLTALEYKIPELMLGMVESTIKPELVSLDILDLGCGTGLCGQTFKKYAKGLVGVDISKKMLEQAMLKKIYDELVEKDFLEYLQITNSHFDLVIAGDVLVYLGALENLFGLIKKVLNKNGYFIFNAEISNDDNFQMKQSGRFAHQKNYIDTLASENNLTVVSYEVVVTRFQNNEPVQGHLYLLRN